MFQCVKIDFICAMKMLIRQMEKAIGCQIIRLNMTNYSKRTQPIISRESYSNGDDWLDDFANHLNKNSVQPKRYSDSIYEQLSSIIKGNKPRYPNVEAAVKDMRERTGLAEFTKQLKAENSKSQNKTASENLDVELFKKIPQLKHTIDNYISDTRGNLLVPEILDRVKSIHKKDIADNAEWSSPSLLTYIYKKNKEEKELHPDTSNYNELGKLDLHSKEV